MNYPSNLSRILCLAISIALIGSSGNLLAEIESMIFNQASIPMEGNIASDNDLSIDDLIDLDALEEEIITLEKLMEVETTVASTKGQTIFNSPSTVTIIDATTIEKYNFQSVAEAVRVVAGFDVSRSYLKRSVPTARGILQSHYANKVLVMINDVPSWHAVTGEGNLERINIHNVKQIEVLKGPASVKYGTNAYAGAVNVVLKSSPGKRKGEYHVGVGSDGRKMAGAAFLNASDDGVKQDSLFLNIQDYKGFDYSYTDRNDVTANIDEFIDNSNLTWSSKGKHYSMLANIYDGGESYLGVVPDNTRGAGIEHEMSGRLFNYTVHKEFSENTKLKFTGTYDWNERTLARSLNTAAEITGYRLNGGLLLSRTLSDTKAFEFGFDYDDRTSKAYRNYDVNTGTSLGENNLQDKSLKEHSLFSTYNWSGGAINGSAGIRWTDNEEFGSNVSYNLSLVHPLGDQKSLKLIYAQSFRTPSLFELNFVTGTGTVYGNLDLEPEESDSIELAFLQKEGNFFLQTTVYSAQYDNKILRTRGDGTGPDGTPFVDKIHYVNGEEFSALGIEFEGRFENPRRRGFNGLLNLGYIDGDDDDRIVEGADTDVFNFMSVPKFTAMLGIDKQLGDEFSSSAALNYRTDCRDTEGEKVGSVVTVDLNVQHRKPGSSGRIDFSIKNIFDNEAPIPEYVRTSSSVPEVPGMGYGREFIISYTQRF